MSTSQAIMEPVMMEPVITKPVIMELSGSAMLPRPAERALIALEVSATANTSATACSKVTKTAEEFQNIFETLSSDDISTNPNCNAALTRWSRASLQTTSDVPRRKNRSGQVTVRKPIFEASVTFNIRVRNLDMLGRLAKELLQMRLVKINKISWLLTDNTLAALQLQLRRMAAVDALQKAKDYATALGLYNVTPLELFEQQDSMRSVNAAIATYSGGATDTRSTMSLPAKINGKKNAEKNFKTLFFEPAEVSMSVTIGCTFAAV